MKRRYQRVDHDEVMRLFVETELMQTEIADRVGCTPGRIIQIVRSRTGMSPTQYRRTLGWVGGTKETHGRMTPPRLVNWILLLHGAGYLTPEISAATGVPRERVGSVLKIQGLPRDNRKPLRGLDTKEIARRYVAGEDTLQLQDAFGVSERTIRRALDREGVSRRPRFGRTA